MGRMGLRLMLWHVCTGSTLSMLSDEQQGLRVLQLRHHKPQLSPVSKLLPNKLIFSHYFSPKDSTSLLSTNDIWKHLHSFQVFFLCLAVVRTIWVFGSLPLFISPYHCSSTWIFLVKLLKPVMRRTKKKPSLHPHLQYMVVSTTTKKSNRTAQPGTYSTSV